MKICITAQGNSIDSKIDSRFGRAPYFILYDTEAREFTAIENGNISGDSGVGIKSAQLMVDNGVDMVITGQVGPKASEVLNAAKIQIKEGVFEGTVRRALLKDKDSDGL